MEKKDEQEKSPESKDGQMNQSTDEIISKKKEDIASVSEQPGIESVDNEQQQDSPSKKALYDVQPVISSLFANAEVTVDPAIVDSLTEGFIQRFLPSLENARKTIGQINSSQTILLDTLQQEVIKFRECNAIGGLEHTMSKAKVYHNKLLRLRREMTTLHEKSAKLKKRSVRLQQQKQKEELVRAHDQEREMEKEKMLTAKVAENAQ